MGKRDAGSVGWAGSGSGRGWGSAASVVVDRGTGLNGSGMRRWNWNAIRGREHQQTASGKPEEFHTTPESKLGAFRRNNLSQRAPERALPVPDSNRTSPETASALAAD